MVVATTYDRRAVLLVSGRLLVDLFRNGKRSAYEIKDGLPEDAEIVGASYDSLRDVWEIAVESAEFPNVAEGCELPRLPPVTETTTFCKECSP